MDKENDNLNIDLAVQLADKKLERQADAHRVVESKIGVVLGFIAVIVASALAVLKDSPELFGINLFSLGMSSLFTSLGLLIFASKTQEYLDPPDFPIFFSAEALSKENLEVKNQVVADMKESYLRNMKKHKTKSNLFNWALYTFLASMVLLLLGILERSK